MNYTKQLKPHPSPEPRVDLAKALKRQAAITDDHGEVNEAAGLIKVLHQSGGDDLLKMQPPGRTTRAVSARARPASGTTARIKCSTAWSKHASRNGSARLLPSTAENSWSAARRTLRASMACVRSSPT